MFDDLALSYPGNNGFSLTLDELEEDPRVNQFLNEAAAHGDLFDAPHTTKEKNRRPRRKWYLNPILSPHFRLPHIRTKEPMYVNLDEVRGWLREVGVAVGETRAKPKVKSKTDADHSQGTLFDPSSSDQSQ